MTQPIAIVSVSGGKDSTATAIRALDEYGADRVRLVFADTGNEHPATIEYVTEYMPRAFGMPVVVVRADFRERIEHRRWYVTNKWPEKGVPQEACERAAANLVYTGNPFLDLCMVKGRFPSRMAQFCTQELKRIPLDRLMLDLMGEGLTVESWRGIRRDESTWRSHTEARTQAAEGYWIVHPIVEWTAQQTVDFVRSRGFELNPLYSQGMKRVGCMPCINCGKDELSEIAKRFPEEIARIREWERIVGIVSKHQQSTFFAAPNGGDDTVDAYLTGNIDQVVEWSKTSRGGVQYDWTRTMEPETCSSVYGLCE